MSLTYSQECKCGCGRKIKESHIAYQSDSSTHANESWSIRLDGDVCYFTNWKCLCRYGANNPQHRKTLVIHAEPWVPSGQGSGKGQQAFKALKSGLLLDFDSSDKKRSITSSASIRPALVALSISA